jgi:hypothetical protein
MFNVRFRSGWKAFLLRRRLISNFKGRVLQWKYFLVFQERVNSFPPPAARSPPVSVTEFQPPYFPPPFSTASMALQQATQLSTWIGPERETVLDVKDRKIIRGLFFTLWNYSILQILLNLPVLKAVLSHQDVFSPSLQHLQAADPYQVTTSIHTFNLNQVGREINR